MSHLQQIKASLREHQTLYITAVILLLLSGGYYYFSGNKAKLDGGKHHQMSYVAQGVKVIKTDEQGRLQLQASIDEAYYDLKSKRSAMQNVQATVFEDNKISATFSAPQVDGENDNQKVVLSQNVTARKYNANDVLHVSTPSLTLYPKQKTLETNHQVTVQSAQAQFTSQGLKADLNTGEYQFSTIRGRYDVQ